jgi:sugar phosphate isomerase/epimerase
MSREANRSLPHDYIESQIGASQFSYLHYDFSSWLFGEPRLPRFDIRPSIIIRSECELLAVSAPRFAVRASYADGSFLNLRRLAFLKATVGDWVAPEADAKSPRYSSRHDSGTPSQFLDDIMERPGSCIADSLLVPPRRLDGYHMLTCGLFKAYGEILNDATRRGVPYMRHIAFGGGMCAQAACFMSTCLLDEYANAVHGTAEITFLSQSHRPSEQRPPQSMSLLLSGMTFREIETYFEQVGLLGRQQARPPITHLFRPNTGTDDWTAISERLLATVIRSYVLSGMPVLVPVDLGLWRSGIQGDGVPSALHAATGDVYQKRSDNKPRNHVVVVVGAHRGDRARFVCNDPATYPFLEVNSRQLYAFREFETAPSNTSGSSVNGITYEASTLDEIPRLGIAKVVPVTPKDVSFPLWDLPPRGKSDLSSPAYGVLSCFAVGTKVLGNHRLGEIICSLNNPEDFGEFRLVRSAAATARGSLEAFHIDSESAIGILQSQFDRWPNWLWLQHVRLTGNSEAIIAWNACSTPFCMPQGKIDKNSITSRIAFAMQTGDGVSWTLAFESPPNSAGSRPSLDAKRETIQSVTNVPIPGLKTALISSFACDNSRSVLRKWPDGIQFAEWYMLAQPDIELLRRRNPTNGRTAMEFMGECWNNPQAVANVARYIAHRIEVRQAGIRVVAMATFLPTISMSEKDERAKVAQRAICFVQRVAQYLAKHFNQRPAVIEIVSGSCINGICPGRSNEFSHVPDRVRPNEHVFLASLMSDDQAVQNLVRNIELSYHLLSDAERDAVIPLAIELEPGPLFVCRNRESLIAICEELKRSQVSHCVGMNLDISHWRLSQSIMAGDLERSHPAVFERIVHGHISGQHPAGHFGDIGLREYGKAVDYVPWLDLLGRRATKDHGGVPFSGFVSLELEACHDSLDVSSVIEEVNSLIRHRSFNIPDGESNRGADCGADREADRGAD